MHKDQVRNDGRNEQLRRRSKDTIDDAQVPIVPQRIGKVPSQHIEADNKHADDDRRAFPIHCRNRRSKEQRNAISRNRRRRECLNQDRVRHIVCCCEDPASGSKHTENATNCRHSNDERQEDCHLDLVRPIEGIVWRVRRLRLQHNLAVLLEHLEFRGIRVDTGGLFQDDGPRRERRPLVV